MRIFILLTALLGAGSVIAEKDTGPWTNHCPGAGYCEHVGKYAYNGFGLAALRQVQLGVIVGVTWKPRGAMIGVSPAIPEAGIPEQIRLSPRDAYYYIIDDGHGTPFLRLAREIRPESE